MDLKEVRWEVMDWIYLAEDGYKLQVHVNMIWNFQIPQNAGNFLIDELLASKDQLYSMEIVH